MDVSGSLNVFRRFREGWNIWPLDRSASSRDGKGAVLFASTDEVLTLVYCPNLSVRDVCIEAAVKVNVAPVALDFFTLVTEDGGLYLNPNKTLTEAECNQTYCFKLSIKACHGEELWDFDPNAFKYYFHQCRQEFLRGTVGEFGENNNDFAKVIIYEIVYQAKQRNVSTKYVIENPNECGIMPLFQRGVFKDFTRRDVKTFLQKNVPLYQYEKLSVETIQVEYIRSLERAEDFFVHKLLFEKIYMIDDEVSNRTFEVQVSAEFGIKKRRTDTERNLPEDIVKEFSEVEALELEAMENTVTIIRKNSRPEILTASSPQVAYSLITLVEGYYRLMINQYKQLLRGPKRPENLLCHGPITRLKAEDLLQKGTREDGSFLLRKSRSCYSSYVLSVYHAKEVKHFRIVRNTSVQPPLLQLENEQRKGFSSLIELIEHYKQSPDGLPVCLTTICEPKTEEPPLEIRSRGPLAIEAYNKALTEGKAYVKRVPIMLIGQDHSGKTSLKKSLMGKPFNPDEGSTIGIDVDPSHIKVSTEIWKVGDNTDAIKAISFEQQAARLVADDLKEEQSGFAVENITREESRSPDVSFSNDLNQVPPGESGEPEVIPKISSDFTLKKEVHLPIESPRIPDEVATLIEKLLKEDENAPDDEEIYTILWDFGGQSVYYTTHPLFITAKAIYLLVYDLSRDPHELAKPVVKQGLYKKILDSYGTKINLDYLNFWMTSVASLATETEEQYVRLDRTEVKVPPVFLVCTHADEPNRGADPFALAREVFGSLQTKPFRNHIYEDVFVVDNTKSAGLGSECSEVTRLREELLAVAKELPQMKEAIPIKWLKYERALQGTVRDGHKWISLSVAKKIAFEVCKIDDDQEFLTLLNFLHDQRILVHFDDTPALSNFVVLDPQWLVDVFKTVITVKPYDQEESKFKELWLQLESTGILDEKLLEHVWGPLLSQEETSASLLAIMEKFSLLCPWPCSNASSGKQYLVPSMLMSHPPKEIMKLVASAQIPPLFLRFQSGQVPPGFFPRLVLQLFQWGQDEFWSAENPQLYADFARFYTSADDDCSVILLCHSSCIEVVVHRGNLSANPTECLQSKLNLSADINYGAFEVACARAVRRQLGLMLECMRKEFFWLKNMMYELGVICPVCCQECKVNYCCTHHKQCCEREECLHFWFESDLRCAIQFVRCRRCAAAQSDKVYVKQFAPWFDPLDEQILTDESEERRPASGGGIDEKVIALPSKAIETIMSRLCHSREVVLQLKDSLQLDQNSLEQPDPGTKRLIRCLANKAKQSNRLDVVKQLRDIAPAGTTGPLLPEHLDIGNIPVRQMTDLTLELSGGEEWKLVAEELGLSPREIRYIDKRVMNPCEAVLAYISRQCSISVGELYDRLNKCGLPVTADLL